MPVFTSSSTRAGKTLRQGRSNAHDAVYTILFNAFGQGTEKNPLKPSTHQALALNGFPKMSIFVWYTYININNIDMYLFGVGGHQESLQIRVNALCTMLTKDGKLRPLVMMDGHGRTLYLVIKFLFENGYTEEEINGNIKVVDIDEGAVMWHERFFPSGVETFDIDIFDAYEKQMKINQESVFYFNFCGIKTKENCSKSIKIMRENSNVMLSFSLERNAKHSDHIQELDSFCQRECFSVLDNRQHEFPTYINKSI